MENKKKIIQEVCSYVGIILLVIFIKIFIVSPIRVNGDSMYNTLVDQDIMILNEMIYNFTDIKRYDIVVVDKNDEYLIKRVIGLPGETVKCEGGNIYINGHKIADKYAYSETADFLEVVIDEDEYFVLGDNRSDSLDSRAFGTFKEKDIKGKANFTIYPFSRFGKKE